MESFRDAVAVVTGAASGIGAALAVQLASEGAHLVLADVNSSEETERAVRAAGAKVLSVSTDVSNRASVENLAEQAYSTFGRVNLLCNNAGVVLFGPMAEISEDQWDWILAINVKGVINGVSVFLPRMLAQTDARHVLNTVSGAGLVASGVLPLGAYTTSKFAAMGFTESLRNELAPRGIGVTALCPGSVETRILDSAQYTDSVGTLRPPTTGAPTPTREGIRRMSPYEVAALALEGVRTNQPYVLTHPESFDGIEARFVALRLAAEHAASRLGLDWPAAASPSVQRRKDSERGSRSD